MGQRYVLKDAVSAFHSWLKVTHICSRNLFFLKYLLQPCISLRSTLEDGGPIFAWDFSDPAILRLCLLSKLQGRGVIAAHVHKACMPLWIPFAPGRICNLIYSGNNLLACLHLKMSCEYHSSRCGNHIICHHLCHHQVSYDFWLDRASPLPFVSCVWPSARAKRARAGTFASGGLELSGNLVQDAISNAFSGFWFLSIDPLQRLQ